MELPQSRQCSECGDHLELNETNFRRYTENGKKGRYALHCRACMNKRRAELTKKQREERNNPTIDPAMQAFLYGGLV